MGAGLRPRAKAMAKPPDPKAGAPVLDSTAYADGFVADSAAWIARKPQPWSRGNPDHERVARRRIREAVRFVRAS